MANKKKKNLETLKLADGKSKEDPQIAKVKELEDLLGIKKVNPFGTYNLDVLKEKLNDMTIVDMQRLCERVGIFGSGSRQELREKLLREFKSISRGTLSITTENPAVQLDPKNPLHQQALKILGEM